MTGEVEKVSADILNMEKWRAMGEKICEMALFGIASQLRITKRTHPCDLKLFYLEATMGIVRMIDEGEIIFHGFLRP